jgi:hypothetical protein
MKNLVSGRDSDRPSVHTPQIAALFLAALIFVGPASTGASPITIGPGPALGTDRAGVTWYQEFQDWTHDDLRALDDAGLGDSVYGFGDGLDDSRDLVAFYFRDEGANLYFRVDLYDLALGAETSALDLYVAVDAAPGGQVWLPDFLDCTTDRPWELCVAVYQSGTGSSDYRLYRSDFTTLSTGYLGAYFNSQLDAVEFGITRQSLLDAGWDGSSPLTFQVFTTKDGAETSCTGGGNSSDLADAIVDDDRGCSDGVLNGGIASTDTAGVVYYATIAHGNQSVNRVPDIGAHIYDPESNTGISGGTGFQRTLDTHEIFGVPLNIHPSGTLTIACNWARTAGGASDPQDGPAFLARIRQFVDNDQSHDPGSLIGGVLAEHIMPYFEGPVNAASIALEDSLNQVVYGVSAADAGVMHTPERVIRSQSTGLSPLDGHTFEDIAASPYVATYLDEVTHLHDWFDPGESCQPDAGYRHKVHEINGVYCFMINDREDQAKFGNHDGGMVMDTRYSLLQKALYGNSSEIVTVFDDWEALAGKSFNPASGVSVPNNNPNQYHATIRWAANHPWIRISNLKDLLQIALADPADFVIDQGTRYDLPIDTYQWLRHASEDSYNNWYYNESGGLTGNEQDFYHLVPVLTGPQGDYHARSATPADDGPPLPSGMTLGDMNTPGTILHDAWAALDGAPAGRLRELGEAGYLAMIYETAWHEEDQTDYSDTDCYEPWLYPDGSWDGVNTWALKLQNHVRQSGLYAAAAAWAADVRDGLVGPGTVATAEDLDLDGEDEYVVRNNRAWAALERYGGRCVLAVAYDPVTDGAEVIVGAPITNPSAPGEEEYTGGAASRCSAFKDMNGGGYADAVYAAAAVAGGWRFTSPDGRIVKTITLPDGGADLTADYQETVSGDLYVRFGLSPNPLDLAFHGRTHLTSNLDAAAGIYALANSAGGAAVLRFNGATWNPSPADAGYERRALALTEEEEVHGDGAFRLVLTLIPGVTSVTGVPDRPAGGGGLALAGPAPSPGAGPARLAFTLPDAAAVTITVLDVRGRRVLRRDLGRRGPGRVETVLEPTDGAGVPWPAGVFFVRVEAGALRAVRKWVVVR